MKAVLRFFRSFGWVKIGNGMERCVFTGIVRGPTPPTADKPSKGQ